ncbi:MAG: transporter, partial [Ignavibacteriota bacterium]
MFALPAAISVAIGTLDTLIVVFYLLATTLLGIWLGRGQKNNRDYFLAGHKLPTWALLLSIVATETSTVTFLSVPGKSFIQNGNFTFLQLAFGYIIGRFAIIL